MQYVIISDNSGAQRSKKRSFVNSPLSHCFAVESSNPLIPLKQEENLIPLLDKEGLGVVEQ
jgi:hypothetical protein